MTVRSLRFVIYHTGEKKSQSNNNQEEDIAAVSPATELRPKPQYPRPLPKAPRKPKKKKKKAHRRNLKSLNDEGGGESSNNNDSLKPNIIPDQPQPEVRSTLLKLMSQTSFQQYPELDTCKHTTTKVTNQYRETGAVIKNEKSKANEVRKSERVRCNEPTIKPTMREARIQRIQKPQTRKQPELRPNCLTARPKTPPDQDTFINTPIIVSNQPKESDDVKNNENPNMKGAFLNKMVPNQTLREARRQRIHVPEDRKLPKLKQPSRKCDQNITCAGRLCESTTSLTKAPSSERGVTSASTSKNEGRSSTKGNETYCSDTDTARSDADEDRATKSSASGSPFGEAESIGPVASDSSDEGGCALVDIDYNQVMIGLKEKYSQFHLTVKMKDKPIIKGMRKKKNF